jgi:hypothetical protein
MSSKPTMISTNDVDHRNVTNNACSTALPWEDDWDESMGQPTGREAGAQRDHGLHLHPQMNFPERSELDLQRFDATIVETERTQRRACVSTSG